MEIQVVTPKTIKAKEEVKIKILEEEIEEEDVEKEVEVEVDLINKTSNIIIITCMVILREIVD